MQPAWYCQFTAEDRIGSAFIQGSNAIQCFSADSIVQGRIILLLTFLPGLVLGWLFIRTKSLLAPILFHGLANTCYCLMAATFI
ncbi:MAG: CPBP family intramembrane metalloprotease [Planctomycetes bacterium]|nr:CPBP family intramembrane metalloprotease [Planctomycetota bacterium]